MKTDLDTSMGELVATVENAVEDMNLQEEAANSGYETIRGFISAAEDPDLLGKVSAAYANLAQKAKDAINKNLDIHSPSRETEWSGEMVGEGLIRGVQNTTTEMEQEMKLYTDSLLEAASPQETEVVLLAPQLLEQVASLRSSFAPEVAVASSAESGGVVIHIHPEYHIAANESTESIEEQLRRNDDVLRDLVRDELEEIGIDARRVSFQ